MPAYAQGIQGGELFSHGIHFWPDSAPAHQKGVHQPFGQRRLLTSLDTRFALAGNIALKLEQQNAPDGAFLCAVDSPRLYDVVTLKRKMRSN